MNPVDKVKGDRVRKSRDITMTIVTIIMTLIITLIIIIIGI